MSHPANFEGYHICEVCNKWVREIELDHILGRGSHPELVFEEENIRKICWDCHRRKHGQR